MNIIASEDESMIMKESRNMAEIIDIIVTRNEYRIGGVVAGKERPP